MRPCEAYALLKHAADDAARDRVLTHANAAKDYVLSHRGEITHNVTNNVAYGLLSNPRGSGSSSILGASAGGIIDGILMKPVADAALNLADRGLRKFYNTPE